MNRHDINFGSIRLAWHDQENRGSGSVDVWARCFCGTGFHGSGGSLAEAIRDLEDRLYQHMEGGTAGNSR